MSRRGGSLPGPATDSGAAGRTRAHLNSEKPEDAHVLGALLLSRGEEDKPRQPAGSERPRPAVHRLFPCPHSTTSPRGVDRDV